MRFTLGTEASTLTHPVQLCLVAIPMIVPSTYRKCIHSLSSKTVTSGYDSLKNDNNGSVTDLNELRKKSLYRVREEIAHVDIPTHVDIPSS